MYDLPVLQRWDPSFSEDAHPTEPPVLDSKEESTLKSSDKKVPIKTAKHEATTDSVSVELACREVCTECGNKYKRREHLKRHMEE